MDGLFPTREEVVAELRAEVANGDHCPICGSTNPTHSVTAHPARKTDPGTSHSGARDVRVRAGSQRHDLLTAYARESIPGRTVELTPDEARRAAGLDRRSCYWKRVSELAQAGLLELTGHERNGEAGSAQRIYRISAKGKAALDG